MPAAVVKRSSQVPCRFSCATRTRSRNSPGGTRNRSAFQLRGPRHAVELQRLKKQEGRGLCRLGGEHHDGVRRLGLRFLEPGRAARRRTRGDHDTGKQESCAPLHRIILYHKNVAWSPVRGIVLQYASSTSQVRWRHAVSEWHEHKNGAAPMQNTVVVHLGDGTLLKGTTNNFFPNKEKFHLTVKDTTEIREVPLTGLKAVFFVKDFEGDPNYQERGDAERSGLGKRIEVEFKDGENLVGYSQGYTPNRPGFFVFPADPESNNDRIFVLTAATKSVRFAEQRPAQASSAATTQDAATQAR
jgi:hypothetical protein